MLILPADFPKIIAHRGASVVAPENSASAFLKAHEAGCRWIECDLRLTKDNQLVVFHDDTLDRTTNGSGPVNAYSYSELLTLDAGSWFSPQFAGEKIMHFQSLIAFLNTFQMCANLEIKGEAGAEEETCHTFLKYFQQGDPLHQPYLISSFSINVLTLLHQKMPTLSLALLIDHWDFDWQSVAKWSNCISIHVSLNILTPEKIKEIKKLNKKIAVYVVNDLALAKKLWSHGVDAIFTDVPDKIS